MANNRIDLTLGISADTSQARQQFNLLKKELQSISSIEGNSKQFGFNSQIVQATKSARELETMLNKAFDVNTGKLNLTSFSKQLTARGKDLNDYRESLSKLGPQGTEAFNKVALSIANAEPQLSKMNGLTQQLWTSLKNVAKYQLSTAVLRAFTSAIGNAVSYAKDLNKSLVDISIVTGYSTDKMARFAAEANKSAQALSATTDEYAKASLIYFQQGLNDAEVKDRTDVTMKMAAVTGQAASEVSDQMTAVWNNFAKHGEDLERFSDKMVALGAATASSSTEIATGLKKFAPIADTVGLSFDYAAAALATVTATTRESAETVGTAFKTLFARLESLKLGETLDDGTDLTKYSQALMAVGVNIKNANGELKSMDTIIDETMSKWGTLSKDQQTALAQTVAGMRQYTQFMALMSNADFFKTNLETARDSENALNDQFESYEEGWQAASKRVQNALQGVYQKLIDSDFFINFLNGAEKAIEAISRLIDMMGGLKGVIGTLGFAASKLFGKELAQAASNAFTRFGEVKNNITGKAQADASELRVQAIEGVQKNLNVGDDSTSYGVYSTMQDKRLKLQLDMEKSYGRMSDQQKEYYQEQLRILANEEEYVDSLAKGVEELEKQKEALIANSKVKTKEQFDVQKKKQEALQDKLSISQSALTGTSEQDISTKAIADSWGGNWSDLGDLALNSGEGNFFGLQEEELTKLRLAMQQYAGDTEAQGKAVEEVFEGICKRINEAQAALNENVIPDNTFNTEQLKAARDELHAIGVGIGEVQQEASFVKPLKVMDTKQLDAAKKRLKGLKESLEAIDGIDLDNIKIDEIKNAEEYKEKIKEILECLKDVKKEKVDTFAGRAGQTGEGAEQNGGEGNGAREEAEGLAGIGEQEGAATQAARQTADGHAEVVEEIKQGNTDITASIGRTVSAVTALSFSMTQFTGQMQAWGESLGNGHLELEDFTLGFSSLISGIQTASSVIEVLNTLQDLSTAKTGAAAAAKKLESEVEGENTREKIKNIIAARRQLASEQESVAGKIAVIFGLKGVSAATKENTRDVNNNTLAWYSNPVTAVIAIALMAVVGVIKLVTSAVQAHTQALEEEAEQAASVADESKKEADTFLEQQKAYEDAYKAYKNGTSSKQEFLEVVKGVADQLDNETLYVMAQQGRYEDLNEAIKEVIKNKLIEAQIDAHDAVVTKKEEAEDKAGKGVGIKASGGSIQPTTNASSSGDALTTIARGEADKEEATNDFISENGLDKTFSYGHFGSDAWLDFNIDTSNPEEVSQALEDVRKLQTILKQKEADESELKYWKNLEDQLSNFSEEYALMRKEADATLAVIEFDDENFEKDLDSKFDLSKVDQYEEAVNEVKARLLENGVDSDTVESLGEEWFENFLTGVNAEEVGLKNKISSLTDQIFGDGASDDQKEQVEKFVRFLSDADLSSLDGIVVPVDGQKSFENFKDWWNASEDKRKLEQEVTLYGKYDVSTLEDQLKIVKDLKIGDTISDDDFNKLGETAQKYFVTLSDGSHRLVGDINKVKEALKFDAQENLLKSLEAWTKVANQPFEDNTTETAKRISDNQQMLNLTEDEKEELKEINEALAGGTELTDNQVDRLRELNSEIANLEIERVTQQLLGMAENLEEFDGLLSQALKIGGGVADYDSVAQALINLGAQYANTTEEIQELNAARAAGDTEKVSEAVDSLRGAIRIGEAEKNYGLDAKVTENQARAIKALYKEQEVSAEMSAKMAIANQRLNKGATALNKNFADWKNTLSSTKKGTLDNAKAFTELEDALRDLTNAGDDWHIPDGWLDAPENMQLIEDAVDGTEESILALGQSLATATIENMENPFEGVFGSERAAADFEGWRNTVLNGISDLQSELGNLTVGEDITEKLGNDWIQALNDMAYHTNMSVVDMNTLLSQLGVNANVETATKPVSDKVPQYVTEEEVTDTTDPNAAPDAPRTYRKVSKTHIDTWVPVDGAIQVAAIGSDENPPKISFAGPSGGGGFGASPSSSSGGSSGSGGGGGGSSKAPKKRKLTEGEDRYHHITRQIKQSQNTYDELEKARERAYGPKVIDYMKQESEQLAIQKTLYEQKIKEIDANAKADKARFEQLASQAGMSIEYDVAGNIANWDELIRKKNEYYNDNVTGDSDSDEWLSDWEEDFDDFMSKVEQDIDDKEDALKNLADITRQEFDNKLSQLEYTVTFTVEVNESLRQYWDYMDERLDSFIDSFEKVDQIAQSAAARMALNNQDIEVQRQFVEQAFAEAGIGGSGIEALMSKVVSGENWVEEFNAVVKQLEGSDVGSILSEKMTSAISEIIGKLSENINEQNREMRAYIAALDKINEEHQELLDRFEDFKGEIQIYFDIADALGQRMSGLTRGILQEAWKTQIAVQQDQIRSLAAEIDNYKNGKERQKLDQELSEQEAKMNDSSLAQWARDAAQEAYDEIKEKIKELDNDRRNLESQWRDAITEMAQMVKDQFSASIEELIDSFDYAISDMYGSIEALQQAYDQRRTLEEQYIPEYKQIYELNKISRDLSKQIDTTDSLSAQKKLRDFQKEIYDLQNSGKKLSEYDLEYLQKKYDLRVAEIALEDAQNAKTQVRLSRDAEGNYSYVYTANEESSNTAASDYEDKLYALQELNDNRLKDLGSDYLATIAEMEDALRNIAEQDFNSREEYERTRQMIVDNFEQRVAFITSQNEQILQNNKDLYEQDYLGYFDAIQNITSTNEAFQMRNTDFVTDFEQTILGKVLPSYTSMGEHASSVIAAIEMDQNGLIAQIDVLYATLQKNIDNMYIALGETWSEQMTSLEGDERLADFLNMKTEQFETYKEESSVKLKELADNASHEAGRIIASFSGGDSGRDAAYYLDAMEASGASAAALFGSNGAFSDAVEHLVNELGGSDKNRGLQPALLGGANSATLLANTFVEAMNSANKASIGVGGMGNAIHDMVNAVAGSEGNSGYLKTLRDNIEALDTPIIAAGKYASTHFVTPTESAFNKFTNWLGEEKGAGHVAFANAMGAYVGTINPQDFKDKLGGVFDVFGGWIKGITTGDGSPLSNWNAAVKAFSSMKVGNQEMAQVVGTKLAAVTKEMNGFASQKPSGDYKKNLKDNWTNPITDAYKAAYKAAENAYDATKNAIGKDPIKINFDIPDSKSVFDSIIENLKEIRDEADRAANSISGLTFGSSLSTQVLRLSGRLENDLTKLNLTGLKDQNGYSVFDIDKDGKITSKDAQRILEYESNNFSVLDEEEKKRIKAALIAWQSRSFDTGGYTGEWGDSGRLAILHQKELVLNQADTSNILAAVDLVRQASQAIDMSARASQYAMGSSLAAATTTSIANSNDLNQNVTIYAEFPGVSVEAEIQNAFNAMEMQAIQYAHRDY